MCCDHPSETVVILTDLDGEETTREDGAAPATMLPVTETRPGHLCVHSDGHTVLPDAIPIGRLEGVPW